jgi:uncharacterized protein (DUF362 family)
MAVAVSANGRSLRECIDLSLARLGGIGIDGDIEIVIKPNLMSAAWDMISTDLGLLTDVCRYFRECYDNRIVVAETDTLAGRVDDVYRRIDLKNRLKPLDVEIFNASTDRRVRMDNPGGFNKTLYLPERIVNGVRINVPLMKPYSSHTPHLSRLGVSCALKNFFGLIPDKNKLSFHGPGDSKLGKIILDVNRLIPPAFIIAENGDRLLFSKNPVEADAISCKMAGLDPLKIEYLNQAKSIGMGENDPDRIEVHKIGL